MSLSPPPPPPPSPPFVEVPDDLPIAVVIGAVVAGVIFLLICIIAVYLLIKRLPGFLNRRAKIQYNYDLVTLADAMAEQRNRLWNAAITEKRVAQEVVQAMAQLGSAAADRAKYEMFTNLADTSTRAGVDSSRATAATYSTKSTIDLYEERPYQKVAVIWMKALTAGKFNGLPDEAITRLYIEFFETTTSGAVFAVKIPQESQNIIKKYLSRSIKDTAFGSDVSYGSTESLLPSIYL